MLQELAVDIMSYTKKHVDLSDLKLRQSKYNWEYICDHKIVFFASEYTKEEQKFNKWFCKYILKNYKINIPYEHMEIISLLHEVGHHIVGDICTEEEYNYLCDACETQEDYRKIPDEREADLFAVNFYNKHRDKINEIYHRFFD